MENLHSIIERAAATGARAAACDLALLREAQIFFTAIKRVYGVDCHITNPPNRRAGIFLVLQVLTPFCGVRPLADRVQIPP